MSAKYWSRMRKYSRSRPAITLHFTRQEGDGIILVAVANRAAHDLIMVPDGATDTDQYLLVRDYTRDLTREELAALN